MLVTYSIACLLSVIVTNYWAFLLIVIEHLNATSFLPVLKVELELEWTQAKLLHFFPIEMSVARLLIAGLY